MVALKHRKIIQVGGIMDGECIGYVPGFINKSKISDLTFNEQISRFLAICGARSDFYETHKPVIVVCTQAR